jgi:hypothetical protein
MSFAEELAADRRLVVLRALAEMPGNAGNESVVKQALDYFGHRVGSDIVRADLQFLSDHGLLRIEKIEAAKGELWVARLTQAGDDVAAGRSVHPGVKRRGAE